MNKEMNIHIKKRFVKDYNLPIQVLEDPYFDYFIDLYESTHRSRTKYNFLLKMIETYFDNNPNLFLEEYAKVRDNIITSMLENEHYIEFNTCDLNEKYNNKRTVKKDLYIETNDGKCFLSIDLKKANFQSLRFHNPEIVYNCKDYESFIDRFCTGSYQNEALAYYIKDSKYTRQVIFGKLNPSRQINVQTSIMNLSLGILESKDILNKYGLQLYSLSVDEMILEVVDSDKFYSNSFSSSISRELSYETNVGIEIMFYIGQQLDIFVHVDAFTLNKTVFRTYNDNKKVVYTKNFLGSQKAPKIFCAPSTFYAQIHKQLLNLELESNDLLHICEDQLSEFKNYLKLDKDE